MAGCAGRGPRATADLAYIEHARKVVAHAQAMLDIKQLASIAISGGPTGRSHR